MSPLLASATGLRRATGGPSARDVAETAAIAAGGGLVHLPRPSPAVEGLCIGLYVCLGLAAATRVLVSASAAAAHRRRQRRPDELKRQQTFQRLMVLFAAARALSFLPPDDLGTGNGSTGVLRDMINRLALCLFFSLVLFQVLFWVDIANPKLSARSRRIWMAFLLANAAFYVVVLGLCVGRANRPRRAAAATAPAFYDDDAWDLAPVLLIALGSLASALGLLYSTCKTRRRVLRVLRQSQDRALPKRLHERVEAKLQRALALTNLIMGACSALFLLRTVLYVQRPFSHQECGAIRDPNACILIGYGLPELVPCALFLVLMWEVEPNLELPARRKSSINAVAVARATESTPLLFERGGKGLRPGPRRGSRDEDDAADDDDDAMATTPTTIKQPSRPSSLSSALGGSVIAHVRRRLKRMLEGSFMLRSDDEGSATEHLVAHPFHHRESSSEWGARVLDRLRERLQPDAGSPSGHSQSQSHSRVSSSSTRAETSSAYVWMSFQCFNLRLPSSTSSAKVFLALHRLNPGTGAAVSELGRTEIAFTDDPTFSVMLPVEMNEADVLRASVYSVLDRKTIQDLDSQWLIGDAVLPLSAYFSPPSTTAATGPLQVVPGTASVHELLSPLSKTNAAGELVVRCEADIFHGDTIADEAKWQRITRGFVYLTDRASHVEEDETALSVPSGMRRPCSKLLVEEELIESVYTWEMPYQLLQLILADLLIELEVLKRSQNGHELDDDDEVATDDALAHEPRSSNAPSIGMLSEMILQIQDDSMERKTRKWRAELIANTEKYIGEVEAAILRYEDANHGGLTFKPSTMKADSGLSFLALNLHQQLLTVGNPVPATLRDVRPCPGQYVGDTDDSATRYVKLVESSLLESPSPSPYFSDAAAFSSLPEEEDEMDDEGLNETDEGQVEDENPGDQGARDSTTTTTGALTRPATALGLWDDRPPPPPGPREALRRRVISFDSAEQIVYTSHHHDSSSRHLSREQRELAKSIVAMGFESAMELEASLEAEEEPDVCDQRPLAAPPMNGNVEGGGGRSPPAANTQDPFSTFGMYGTTTVGAFAAHVYGFRHGGTRQLRQELQRIKERMDKEAERAGSDLTFEALERDFLQLKWRIDRRMEVTSCQAMSALATCFQQTLYVHLHAATVAECERTTWTTTTTTWRRPTGLAYLELLADVGFLFSVESLLSTYRHEAGMLGDMDAAVRGLERVQIRLRPVQSPRAAQFRVSVTRGPAGVIMELPLIIAAPSAHATRTMHRVPGQDGPTGAVYWPLTTDDEWRRARRVFRRTIRVVPVLFSQGLNELQTVANTVGKDSLQKEINAENLGILESYVRAVLATSTSSTPTTTTTLLGKGGHDEADGRRELLACLDELREHISRSGSGKHMAILRVSSLLARAVGGGRVTCCKSAKDRTAMSVTLEEARVLVARHGLRPTEREAFTRLLRTHGVRRENARKNIGRAQYCFSALQNFMLPADYQCPPGTGGGGRALS